MSKILFPGLLLSAAVVIPATTRAAEPQPVGAPRLLVTDRDSGLPVSGAVVRGGGKIWRSDETGLLVLSENALHGDSLTVSAVGYTDRRVSTVEVRSHRPLRVELTALTNRLNEAVVQTGRIVHSVNTATQSISAAEVQKNLGNSFASALEQIKGMSMVQTGATIAKPVLHGMYGTRLLIMNNGVRQQGQQWGVDHAPELDANSAGRINVVKGAEAVRYGAEALGGVILLDGKALPYTRSRPEGYLSTLYGSNGRRAALTGSVDAGLPLAGGRAAWRLQGTYLNGGDRSTAHYLLNNTGVREANGSVAFGWKRDRFEADGYYSLFSTRIGVLFSAQMGDEQLLRERIRLGLPTEFYPWTRQIDYPYQKVVHQVAKLHTRYTLSSGGHLEWQAAYQHDDRREFNQRRNFRSHVPTLDLQLESFQTDGRWQQSYADHWTTEAGLFYANVKNTNTPGTGVVPIIPNYVQQNAGVFAIQKYSGDNWGAEAGARLDHQRLNARGIDLYGRPYGKLDHYNNLTYTVGAHAHLLPGLDVLSNVGSAWRAPHVHELYSNGVEHSSGLFARGDANLRPEVSTKWITSLRYADHGFTASVDGYVQWIDNYIFDAPTSEVITMVSGAYPVFQYRATDAFFRGVDAEAKWQILPQLAVEGGAAWVRADDRTKQRPLPYIPSFRVSDAVTLQLGSISHVHDVYVKASHKYVAKQTHFDPATDLIDFTPAAYHLFGAEVGANWVLPDGRKIKFLLTADNLFNREYREYTNRFRYYAHDLGRDVRFMLTWEF